MSENRVARAVGVRSDCDAMQGAMSAVVIEDIPDSSESASTSSAVSLDAQSECANAFAIVIDAAAESADGQRATQRRIDRDSTGEQSATSEMVCGESGHTIVSGITGGAHGNASSDL